ncbi:MAG: hypothetical protein ACRCW2_09395 [Cellulosilyticaceae bacterium]
MDNFETICKLYNDSKIISVNKKDTSKNKDDKRYAFITIFESGIPLVLKMAKNIFTTPQHILDMRLICEHYNNIGVYCPKIVANKNGNYCESVDINGETFILYAEEVKKYKCVNDFSPMPSYEMYRDSIIRSIGLVASKSNFFSTLRSPWHLFDTVKFNKNDEGDENFRAGKYIYDTITNDFPQYKSKMNEIWDIYLQKRKDFEPIYRTLPKAVFQADLNYGNVMLNENMEFAGVIDFNLAGTEVILNYILCECCYPVDTDELEELMDNDFLNRWDDYLIYNLGLIKEHYSFTREEIDAYNLAYNTIVPFACLKMSGMLRWAIRVGKVDHIPKILDFIYYQLTRKDLELSNIF